MISAFQAMSVPQLHSPDYYWRIPEQELAGVRLQHLITVEDAMVLRQVRQWRVPGRRAGFTEWEGLEQGAPLSLGWDWVELDDGDIQAAMALAPRTNIMPIDAKGYDIPGEWSAPHLWELIAGLPWKQFVRDSLPAQETSAAQAS
jgi:Domain of unknown function (DUF4902)